MTHFLIVLSIISRCSCGPTPIWVELFDLAFETDPNNVVALTAKAELMAKTGDIPKAIELFDLAYQTNPHDVVALNSKANLLAKNDYIEDALIVYQQAEHIGCKNDPYTLCGLGFLLLKRNKDELEINEAIKLFAQAGRIPGSETIASLGLWVAHARLGDEIKAEKFEERYHQRKQVDLEWLDEDAEDSEASFNQIKHTINVAEMADPEQYRFVIATVFIYVQSVLMYRQMRSHLYKRRF